MIEHREEIPPRRFYLQRNADASGVSGTGIVAYGVCFNDNTAVIRWNTVIASTASYQHVDDIEKIHGHEGSTEIVWID